MKSELRKKLQTEIDKSGIPVEIRAVDELRCAHWFTIPSLQYQDAGGNPHEMDIYASLILPEDERWPHFPPGIDLVVECKRSREKPWIFFEDNVETIFVKEVFQKLRILSDTKSGILWPPAVPDVEGVAQHHYADTRIPVARSYIEAFRNEQNEIFGAFSSIWFAEDCAKRWFHAIPQSGDDGAVLFDGEFGRRETRPRPAMETSFRRSCHGAHG